jgi:hypothetical protein
MVSINQSMRMVKEDLADLLEAESIFEICREAGHRWRRCVLNPAVLIHVFAMQILCCNTACTHLRILSGLSFTASAYCQARKRLPLKVIQMLVRRIGNRASTTCNEHALWHNRRVWRVDGSSVSMPDTAELQKHFGQPSGQAPGCGFPVASTLSQIHAGTGFLMGMLARPLRTHEMSGAIDLHEQLRPRDVIVADRGFCSYAHLCLVVQGTMDAVFRIHHRIIVNFHPRRRSRMQLPRSKRTGRPMSRYVRRLGRNDQVVEYVKPEKKPEWMSPEQYEQLPDSLTVRELRYEVRKRGCRVRQVTLVTTLLDPQEYPAEELAKLYGERWQIEVDFRHLKTTMRMEVLHCKTVEGVLKEMWMYMLVYNLVRQVMLAAAEHQETAPDRISFIDALRWLRCAKLGEALPDLVENPVRPWRIDPRVIKRRMKEYRLMTRPRQELREALLNTQLSA